MPDNFASGFLSTFTGILAAVLAMLFVVALVTVLFCGGCAVLVVEAKRADDAKKADEARIDRAVEQRRLNAERESRDEVAPDAPE